ncbi:Gfo/Idh/MocA family protein [Oceanobacillus sojae]|uniref:Gfo/Idh/MocA family protein n=1 Tax=Oceanobacillus sojae TaxID=582851 RepID=UPI00158EF532|nr:Gfo/Idh/MocA family oxidoreductase [Oceanobacillus sojae]MCT1902551.1 Gfo/Idh/MocA family oxidoreductase [Oceanobacillus sojae]
MIVGIIGCGSITRFRHAPEYRANPSVKEIVFYDRNPERAEEMKQLFGGRTASSLEALLQDSTVDAISDCSSNEAHYIHTTKALQAGKHVLCEKPIAATVEQAEKMVRTAKETGKLLMVDHNQRFTKAHQKAREILRAKELGEILSFQTTFGHSGPEDWGATKSKETWFFKKDRSHSGAAGDLGIHKLDLLFYLLDDDITNLHSYTATLDKTDENGQPIEVNDNVVCILKTAGGSIGTATFSWTYYGEENNSTTIYCQEGIMKIYQDKHYPLLIEKKNGENIYYALEGIQTNTNQTNSGVIDAFIHCIQEEKKPIVSGEDALKSLRLLEEILQQNEERM